LEVSLDLVKKLRDKTGAGISDSKKALIETDGDFEKAIEYLRKKGAATSQKRIDRIAKEGIIFARTGENRTQGAIVEVNCETDFVARSDAFKALAEAAITTILHTKSHDLASLLTANAEGHSNTIQQVLDGTTASVGEKLEIKRAVFLSSGDGFFCAYNHPGNKLACLMEVSGKPTDEGIELGNNVAMQVVAMKPLTIDRSEISKEMIEKEKEIYMVQAVNEGKAQNIAERIAANKVEKFFEENCLLEQEYVRESGKSVSDYINSVSKAAGIEYKIKKMVRYQLGETLYL